MPPPRAAISAYVAPWLRSSNSSTRVPANTGCVCASTKPGSTTRPPASTTVVLSSINFSMSAVGPTRSINPLRTKTPPRSTMAKSRNSGPTRGRAGPASVTTCDAPTIASDLLSFADNINDEAESVRYQHGGNNFRRKQQRTGDVGDGNDGEADVDQGDDESRRAGELEPPRCFDAERLHSK